MEIKPLKLSELTGKIGGAITQHFSGGVWVVAEVSECKVNAASGHCYLSLVERAEGGKAPLAELRGAIWKHSYNTIAKKFYKYTSSEISSGMKLLFYCKVTYHSLYGLSLVIEDIDPTYTLGESERQRQETIARLQQDGVFSLQREQNQLPYVVQNIAVISSANAAGYEDFMQQIAASSYRFEVELYEATMQGEQTSQTIVAALSRIISSGKSYDAVVIIRGGGSASDLRWFDNYALCYYISQFPIAVLTGIGHEKDVSVADMVAYHYFKTPTAVAAGLIERIGVVDNKLLNLWGEMNAYAESILMGEWQRVNTLAQELRAATMRTMQTESVRLQRVSSELPALSKNIVQGEMNHLQHLTTALKNEATFMVTSTEKRISQVAQTLHIVTVQSTQREAHKLNTLSSRLLPLANAVTQKQGEYLERLSLNVGGISQRTMQANLSKLEYLKLTFIKLSTTLLDRQSAHLNVLSERVASHNPRRILSLGYSLAMDSGGRVLKSVEGLSEGDTLRVELSDGVITTNINNID
ncbi:MAG: exodeoxyribonuclease VII large subunit [Rikenellaceae bacterium]